MKKIKKWRRRNDINEVLGGSVHIRLYRLIFRTEFPLEDEKGYESQGHKKYGQSEQINPIFCMMDIKFFQKFDRGSKVTVGFTASHVRSLITIYGQ